MKELDYFNIDSNKIEKPIFKIINSVIVILFYLYFLFPFLNRFNVVLVTTPRIITTPLTLFNKRRNKNILARLYSEPIFIYLVKNDYDLHSMLFHLIQIEKNKWFFQKSNKEIKELLDVSMNHIHDCENLVELYFQKYNLDLIEELKDLCSSYESMNLVLSSFIKFEFIEATYPYNKFHSSC